MTSDRWEFWIDVGGTFTDCFARRPDGALLRHKLLSSGVTKGSVAASSSLGEILDPLRAADPPGFWDGFQFRLLDASGRVQAEATVARFDPSGGRLQFVSPLAEPPAAG